VVSDAGSPPVDSMLSRDERASTAADEERPASSKTPEKRNSEKRKSEKKKK